MIFRFLLLFLLLLAPTSLRATAEDAGSPGPPLLAPVNHVTRFFLAETLPQLAVELNRTDPETVVLRSGEFRREDRSILTQLPEAEGKIAAWVEMSTYWIEPITPPPSQGDPLIVPIDDMRIAEVQGEVSLLETMNESEHRKPLEVNEDMEVPEGALITTAESGSAAILVGGHTSVRLVPHSQAQFHYDTSGATPTLKIDLRQGAVFCKVGKLSDGRAANLAVQGPIGTASSLGSSDFLVQSDPVSMHVGVMQGRLLVGEAVPLDVGNMNWYPPDIEATPSTGLRMIHWPVPTSSARRKEMDGQLLRFALGRAEALNVKIKSVLGSGEISSEDRLYLAQIPRLVWYARAESHSQAEQ